MSSSNRWSRLPVLFLFILSGVACSTRRPPSAAPMGDVVLRVENHQYQDLTVYLMRAEVPLRIGFVEGLHARVLRIPASYLGGSPELMLRAESRNAPEAAILSPAFHVDRGQTMEWVVRGATSLSSFRVR